MRKTKQKKNKKNAMSTFLSGYKLITTDKKTFVDYNSARYKPNFGSMLVPRRRRWPAFIQHWTVIYAGGNVSTEYTLTPTQCRLNAGPASSALTMICLNLFILFKYHLFDLAFPLLTTQQPDSLLTNLIWPLL